MLYISIEITLKGKKFQRLLPVDLDGKLTTAVNLRHDSQDR